MDYISPKEKLFDLVAEYQIHYNYTFKEAIAEMRKNLQDKKKTEQYKADYGVQLGKYQTI